MTNSLPPRGRRRRLRGGLPQRRGRPGPRGGADTHIGPEITRKQVHDGRNPLFPAPRKRVLRQPGQRVLLRGAVTVPGPRLAPSAGRGARRCSPCSSHRRLHPRLSARRVHPGHRHHPYHGHHGACQHPGAERVAWTPALARSHLSPGKRCG